MVSPLTETQASAPSLDDGFPIVGIGCSAGGLEALEEFFGHLPSASGMAVVVVQHLDPNHPSMLPELLQQTTAIPVSEVKDQVEVRPNNIYVIAPNRDLSLLNGVLHLQEPTLPRGQHLPIDLFLQSLAKDQGEGAVGVILSGMGSDGMLGLRAIEEVGGVTLAQDPASAQAASMPKSAIDAGVVDIVATPALLPALLLKHLAKVPPSTAQGVVTEQEFDDAMDKIISLLRHRSGNDFSLYKLNTLQRRIERRIALHRLDDLNDYFHYLQQNPHELDLLFKELLIGVTSFFRDPELWETLRCELLPELLARYPAGRALRAWIPACSSGEEAYSLAMVFHEVVAQMEPAGRFSLQIYATDLDLDAINKARRGVYPLNIVSQVTPERLARHFVVEAEGYRISKEIRDMVIFAPQNVISDPLFTKLDLLSCRNLLIYLRPELQRRLIPLFHFALNRDGLLILGSAETVGNFVQLFAPVDGGGHLFRRLDGSSLLKDLTFPERPSLGGMLAPEYSSPECSEDIGELVDSLIQQTYAPPAVLVNAEGDIIYISGRTGRYLEPAAGKVNINIFAMAREGLGEALIGTIHKALRQSQPLHLNGIQVGANGDTQIVDLILQGMERPDALRGKVLILFKQVATKQAKGSKEQALAMPPSDALIEELLQTREALRITREETQATLEERKAINEELQSSNEELTTSREEMQSMNEELQTVNAELQAKIMALTYERNDMTNLLNSTEIATIFLDNKMRLRRYTELSTKLFRLLPGDIGRPLSDIVTLLDYPQLLEDSAEVLRTLVFCERQMSTSDDRWYRVRIMPYRTQDNVIDGVVSTFIDITEIKKLEAELRRREV